MSSIPCSNNEVDFQQRDTEVEKFREGKTWVLIATDLMGRGMDFKGLNCVINYEQVVPETGYVPKRPGALRG